MSRRNPPAEYRVSGLARSEAANESAAFAEVRDAAAAPLRGSGWDPYEVWRTRVKAPQDSRGAAPQTKG